MTGFRELTELHLADQAGRVASTSQDGLRAELTALEDEVAELRAQAEAATAELEVIQTERRRLEGEVESLNGARQRYRDQLMEAKTNDVYRTLLSEIETAGKNISDKETVVLECMETGETAQAKLEAAQAAVAAAEARLASEAKRLRADIESLEDEKAAARERSAAIRGSVPAAFLRAYDRTLEKRGGIGLALAVDSFCTECHVAVRPQVWVEILKQAKLHICPGCGRILYRGEPQTAGVAGVPAGTETAGTAEALESASPESSSAGP